MNALHGFAPMMFLAGSSSRTTIAGAMQYGWLDWGAKQGWDHGVITGAVVTFVALNSLSLYRWVRDVAKGKREPWWCKVSWLERWL